MHKTFKQQVRTKIKYFGRKKSMGMKKKIRISFWNEKNLRVAGEGGGGFSSCEMQIEIKKSNYFFVRNPFEFRTRSNKKKYANFIFIQILLCIKTIDCCQTKSPRKKNLPSRTGPLNFIIIHFLFCLICFQQLIYKKIIQLTSLCK